MPTTFKNLIDNTRNELQGGWPDRINRTTGAMDTTTTQITLGLQVVGINIGSVLSINLENVRVLSTTGQNVQVIRGYGTPVFAHPPESLVYVAPAFSNAFIAQRINECLGNLTGEGLFAVRTVNIDYVPARSGYDVPADDIISVLDVRYSVPGPAREWPRLLRRDWTFDQAADATEFPSGNQLLLRQGGFPGRPLKITYKGSFHPLEDPDDDVAQVSGLHPEAHDLPVLYAAYRLNTGREVVRSLLNRQPEPRRQEEVPPGSARMAEQTLYETYLRRIKTELDRLSRRYPEAI